MPGDLTDVTGLAVAGLLGCAAAGTAWQVPRRMVISRRGGVIECALRPGSDSTWRQGLACCERTRLSWYASPGLRLRPQTSFSRSHFRIVRGRPPTQAEVAELGPGLVIAECAATPGDGGIAQPVNLALSRAALTGVLAWLEAAPRFYLAADLAARCRRAPRRAAAAPGRRRGPWVRIRCCYWHTSFTPTIGPMGEDAPAP